MAKAFHQRGGAAHRGQRGEAAGAAEMSDLLQFVIVAGFGALCFGFGYLIAFIESLARRNDQARRSPLQLEDRQMGMGPAVKRGAVKILKFRFPPPWSISHIRQVAVEAHKAIRCSASR
jgi:hypothetical protein